MFYEIFHILFLYLNCYSITCWFSLNTFLHQNVIIDHENLTNDFCFSLTIEDDISILL